MAVISLDEIINNAKLDQIFGGIRVRKQQSAIDYIFIFEGGYSRSIISELVRVLPRQGRYSTSSVLVSHGDRRYYAQFDYRKRKEKTPTPFASVYFLQASSEEAKTLNTDSVLHEDNEILVISRLNPHLHFQFLYLMKIFYETYKRIKTPSKT